MVFPPSIATRSGRWLARSSCARRHATPKRSEGGRGSIGKATHPKNPHRRRKRARFWGMGNSLVPNNSAPYAKKVQHTESAKNILSSTDSGGRTIAAMTRARTASLGVAILTAIQPLLGAVLMLRVSLVQGVVTTLRKIFKRNHRDWHTESACENLPQATSGNSSQGTNHTHGVILGLDPRISVGSSRGLASIPHETSNQDSRHKAENDSVDVAAKRPSSPPPNGGGAPSTELSTSGLRWGTALTTGTVRTRRHTVPHLTCDRCASCARGSSPVRGRITSAPA